MSYWKRGKRRARRRKPRALSVTGAVCLSVTEAVCLSQGLSYLSQDTVCHRSCRLVIKEADVGRDVSVLAKIEERGRERGTGL